jgi:hypothetical protein
MTFSTRLLSILSSLNKTFHPDELAYLAATSKIEGPIRDRIAYRLHAELPPDLLVHREWRDINSRWADIAVTDEQNRPHYLLELKAHSAPTFEPGYSELIRKDLLKLREAAEPSTELYLIFLFNHVYYSGTIDTKYRHALKYYNLQNFASKQNQFAIDVSTQTKAHWEAHLERFGLSSEKAQPGVRMKAGNYHGMPLWIHAYVLGPLYRAELVKLTP